MCTAIAYKADSFYFGRNLDYERGFGEQIVITPRNYEFNMRSGIKMESHYAMIGVATVMDGYPLYYDGLNEKGLCIAGLNFVGNAVYQDEKDGCSNIAQFEVIPWFLGKCASVREMRQLLKETNITKTQFADNLPAAQLHWIAADKEECIVIETTKDGMTVYDNPIGVLTNNPPFPLQLFSLNNYIKLSPENPKSADWSGQELAAYSRGMGAMGLPGDLSSQSRFIRASFVKKCLICEEGSSGVNQFFHMLDSVKQVRGCCITDDGEYEYTLYSSCCDADKGIYHITTYEDRSIRSFDMNSADLSGKDLFVYNF